MSGLPSGEKTPDGKTPDGKTPDGKTPGGKTPGGKTPGGKTPGDAIEAAGLDLWPMDRTRRGPSESNAL